MKVIARYFNVSLSSAINRGRWLGLIEWEVSIFVEGLL